MPGEALTRHEREVIEVGIRAGRPNATIARELDRDPSTIWREIDRNRGRANYQAERAEKRAVRNRRRPKQARLEADPELASYVAERLQLRDSPTTISIELADGVHGRQALISAECLYQAIYHRRGLDRDARKCLHLRRRKRKHRNTNHAKYYSHPLGSYRSVHDRPQAANDRSEIGHLEGDLITGTYNRSALITVFDRASRHCWIQPTANKSADAVHDALIALFDRIPAPARKTLTWDQGSELARWAELAERTGIDIYICDKNSPWQRPTNENGNSMIRRYVGNGTNLNLIPPDHITWIEDRINTTPRRIHHWHTAKQIYDQLIVH